MLRLRLACASFLVCALACANDDLIESASSHANESGTASETTANNETSDTASSGDGDGDGDDDEPTTTGDGDGDGDGEPTTGDGDGEPTTGDGDGDGDGDGTTGDGDGDGDPIPEYYGECPFNEDDECEGEEFCLDQAFENWQVCTTSCSNVNDCPPAPPNTNVQCIAIDGNIFNKGCFLNCEGNFQCPQGMSCESENAGVDKICVFDT